MDTETMMHRDSKIYVAGHIGMVGSAVMRILQREGYKHIITRSMAELDLLRQVDVEAFFEAEKPEFVFLCAAKVGGIVANNEQRAEFLYQNLQIQNNVIATAYASGVRKLLFLGSSCIYPKHAPQPIREEYLLTGELEPTNEPYAIAKIAGLKLCESYNRQYGANFISAMPTNMYGPNDNYNLRSSHVLPALIRKFHLAKLLRDSAHEAVVKDLTRHGEIDDARPDHVAWLASQGVYSDAVHLWGSGTPRREFLHVDDCARALLLMMQAYNSSQFLNIGCGEDVAIRDLAELVRGIVGFEGDTVFDVSKPDGTPRKLLDTSRIQSMGWAPSRTLEEGIRETYRVYASA